MSTRALICVPTSDAPDSLDCAYLHFDGYPDDAGVTLREKCLSLEIARILVSGGGMRSLTGRTGERPEFYGDQPAVTVAREALSEHARRMWASYVYVWEDDGWRCYYAGGDEMKPEPIPA